MHNMALLPLTEPAGVLVKTTCVDYPGRVAGSFFLKGCNLRCPYCYNTALVDPASDVTELNTVQELFDHLEKRKNLLKGLVLSGGEPLLNPYTPIIIKKAKELGYLIKLDTNGTLPQQLENLINDPLLKPDFIAMDIKTSPSNYASLLCKKNTSTPSKTIDFNKVLKQSIDIISTYEKKDREFRTVLVPGLVNKNVIKNIAELLPSDAIWQFAPFQNKNCLDPEYNLIYPYTDAELQELTDYAKTLIPGAALR